MNCPNCGTDDVARAAVVWENNVQIGRNETVGVGLTAGGIGVGAALTSTHSQTLAATRLGPPGSRRVKGRFWISLFWSLIWSYFASSLLHGAFGPGSPWTIVLTLAGVVAIFGYFAFQRGKVVRQVAVEDAQRVDAWSKTWYCKRCGHTSDQAEFHIPAQT